ncbi:hypothetical protein SAMN05880501_108126 [Ureibacillus xyleni]|uniref:Uncharacterized protein n=1 Tax=Ureibacillus xyleni TaxID=614648 RepID=A0A285T3Z4_9BACL|nr:hypothetical protein [Ureibacillus xyleni]SOC15679.1 hypothetical protein SAMN05880501_108126 [Ureibacillus xyleni]
MENEKGSKLQIQHYVNHQTKEMNNAIIMSSPSLLTFLDKELQITWYSPLEENNHKEYRNEFLTLFEDWKDKRSILETFWTRQGPQWDGFAVVQGKNNQKGLLLVEAKAHVNEMKSKSKAVDGKSKMLIESTLEEVKQIFNSHASLDIWLNQYYQLANRLAYLYILNEKLGIPTWLILCNFVEDRSYKPTTLDEWLKHYQEVYSKMDIHRNTSLFNQIITIYPKGAAK